MFSSIDLDASALNIPDFDDMIDFGQKTIFEIWQMAGSGSDWAALVSMVAHLAIGSNANGRHQLFE